MHIYDLTFTDGKRCRCLVMEPAPTEAQDIEGLGQNFNGRLASAERVVPDCPDRLPWRRDGDVWRLHRFELRRDGEGWLVEWPCGLVHGGKSEVVAAVRNNWRDGC